MMNDLSANPDGALATTATSPTTDPAPGADVATTDKLDPNSSTLWRARIDRCKREKKDHLIDAWSENVDYRRGKPFGVTTDTDRVNVNIDWSLTKSKQAQLYSQMPQVFLTPKQPQFAPVVPKFAKVLNDTLTTAKLGTAVNECVIDAINAAGFGVTVNGIRMTQAQTHVPAVDPQTLPPGSPAPEMVPTVKIIDRQFFSRRISPADALWPVEFTGSDFEQADWVGYTDRMLWSEAQKEFNLGEDVKSQVLASRGRDENLRMDEETNLSTLEPVVEFHEIYYWAYRFDPAEQYFKKINRIVFIEGVTEPVVHEQWKGQQWDATTGKYVGSCRRPVQFLTLTYVSDDAIPPSDSAIGRPQVKELIRSRTQIIENRERSKPIRWFDVNRVDPMIQDTLMRGTWQGMIPTQGAGDKAIGEVARSAYPPEEFKFDQVAKSDLQEQWQTGPNQSGGFASGPRSAHEADIVQQNFQTRVGFERARVADFITACAEVLAGLLALYGEFDILNPQEQQAVQQGWDRTHIANEFVYYIRPDSTVLLDANQRIDRLTKLLNLVGKAPFVNPQPIVEELVALHGVDPTTVIVQPPQQPPPPPNISFRFDENALISPIALAMLIEAGMAPNPDQLAAAKKMLQAALGQNAPPEMQNTALAPVTQPNGEAPQPPQPPMDSRPEWTPMPRVTKRVDEIGG